MKINARNPREKAVVLTQLILSVAVGVLVCLQFTGVWKSAIYIFEPLLGVLLLLQGIRLWRESRGVSIFSLIAAAFVFVVTAVVIIF